LRWAPEIIIDLILATLIVLQPFVIKSFTKNMPQIHTHTEITEIL